MKKALVTGASGGIGAAIAENLVIDGYQVVGTFFKAQPEESENIKYVKVDLSDRKSTEEFLSDIQSDSFDCIVNCAGVFLEENVDDFNLPSWDTSIELMLTAPYIIIHKLSKNMPSGSSIINIVSTDGLTGGSTSFGYSAAKAGLINLTKSLSNVLANKGIRVNAVAPGWVDTKMGPEEGAFKETVEKTIPLKRLGNVKEVANSVSFLASNKSSYITGEIINVDGGLNNVDPTLLAELQNN